MCDSSTRVNHRLNDLPRLINMTSQRHRTPRTPQKFALRNFPAYAHRSPTNGLNPHYCAKSAGFSSPLLYERPQQGIRIVITNKQLLCATDFEIRIHSCTQTISKSPSRQHGKSQSILSQTNGVSTIISNCKYRPSNVVRNDHPQNADLPRYYSRREKKPFPIPIVELRRAARERMKKLNGKPMSPAPPPRNGMLVKSLVPVAYEVLNARISLINNLKKLMKAVPVLACKYCNEIHVGPIGHPFRSCRGLRAESRRGLHEWTTTTYVDDVFVPIEAYHLFDRLGRRISHDERYTIPRIPALIELCIQAGVDLPDLKTKRRRKPVIRRGKNDIIDADEDELPDDLDPYAKFRKPILVEIPDSEIIPPIGSEQVTLLASETFEAWDTVRQGAERLMRKYAVRVCGYCPEVHIGYSGHKAQNCGAHKHQQRNGQHGWQRAVLDDLVPPRYVWHVPDIMLEMHRELRNFYGQAPAVVELCIQGGIEVPEKYKSTMRLDIGIPTNLREAEMVV